jgi:hypothetical protein
MMIERNIHHAGNPPSRTCIAKSVRNKSTGLWAASFERWRDAIGEEVLAAKITSGAVFQTEHEADCAADRAMDALQSEGQFPNMCEGF